MFLFNTRLVFHIKNTLQSAQEIRYINGCVCVKCKYNRNQYFDGIVPYSNLLLSQSYHYYITWQEVGISWHPRFRSLCTMDILKSFDQSLTTSNLTKHGPLCIFYPMALPKTSKSSFFLAQSKPPLMQFYVTWLLLMNQNL